MLAGCYLKIKRSAINDVSETLKDNGVSGKILYVSDAVVDSLFGDIVKEQITLFEVLL